VFVSGAGTNLQALIDACRDPGYGAEIVAVGADRDGIPALDRAAAAGIATFVHRVKDYPDRVSWDRALIEATAAYAPDLLVSAGFMKLFGPEFLAAFPQRIVNTHPALTPAFPGMHAVRDALAYGAKVTGCTLFLVSDGVDDGPVIGQVAVPVQDGDDESALHERIKVAERELLVEYVGRMARDGWTIADRKVTLK
jgi:phosphoribosylglycinamide formyltransferase-1